MSKSFESFKSQNINIIYTFITVHVNKRLSEILNSGKIILPN